MTTQGCPFECGQLSTAANVAAGADEAFARLPRISCAILCGAKKRHAGFQVGVCR